MIEKILERLEELKECDLCNGMLCMDCEEKYGGDGCGTRQQSLAIDECKAIVQEVAKEYGNGWIPCSERLPQEDEPEGTLCEVVNVTLKDGTVTSGWCNRYLEKWYVLSEYSDYPASCEYEDVIAWQPLPTPYQKGE